MTLGILQALGGVGLFLLGMAMLTDGLRGVAGAALRRVLARFTRNPLTGAITGALTTAVVQSSSASILAAVGFVAAGLMTFPQALGIIWGANIGTTITGWIVALLGFKLQLGVIGLPLVLAGALMRLYGRGRLRDAGWALAGFSLLFIGIDAMQAGMAAFEGLVTPASFPGDTAFGRLQLIFIGMVITFITQSSSAGVATALVALTAGAVTLPQAAAMVIGMDVGTTFKSALAVIGGSTATRRTGYAHVIYNLFTATMAFFLLTPYQWLVDSVWGGSGMDGQFLLVGFHTGFNTIGVLLVLPFTRQFARLMEWLVPESGPLLTRRLDDRLLGDAAAAVDALAATIHDIAFDLLRQLSHALSGVGGGHYEREQLHTVGDALEQTRRFAQSVKTDRAQQPALNARHVAAMHALDHLTRLQHRLSDHETVTMLSSDARLARLSSILKASVEHVLTAQPPSSAEGYADHVREVLRRQRHGYRARTIDKASTGGIGTDVALDRLDAVRWLHRVSYHVWRIANHLGGLEAAAPAAPPLEDVPIREP